MNTENKKKKILVVGATGIIGSAVVDLLKKDNEVISIGKNNGDYQVDIEDTNSIKQMFKKYENFDGIISTAGNASFKPLEQLTNEDFNFAIKNKLMGQINLITQGIKNLKQGGFILVTTGTTTNNPLPGSSTVSMANGAIEAFVKALSVENTNNIRVNAISPSFVKETMEKMGMDSTHGISAKDTANVYVKTINSDKTFSTIEVQDNLN